MNNDAMDIFAPPDSDAVASQRQLSDDPEFEQLHRRYLRREGAIKGLGWLSYGMALFMALYSILSVSMLISMAEMRDEMAGEGVVYATTFIPVVIMGLFTIGWALAGWGLTTLQRFGRVLATILLSLFALLSLASFLPILFIMGTHGTTMNVLALIILLIPILIMVVTITSFRMLWTQPSKHILARRYREEIIPATSQLKARFPWWVMVLLILQACALILLLVSLLVS